MKPVHLIYSISKLFSEFVKYLKKKKKAEKCGSLKKNIKLNRINSTF